MKLPTLFLPILPLVLLIVAPWARAELITLEDGRVYEGQLLDDEEDRYLFLINGSPIQLPKSMVAGIRLSGEPLPPCEMGVPTSHPPRVLMQGQVFPEPEVVVEDASCRGAQECTVSQDCSVSQDSCIQEPEAGSETTALRPASRRLPAAQRSSGAPSSAGLVDRLWSPDVQERMDARAALANAGDRGLAVLATWGLYNDQPDTRARAATLLGELGGQRVLKSLIEAFYATADTTIPSFNRGFVEALVRQISRLTGQDWHFYLRGTTRAPQVADEMVRWWNQHIDLLPRQLGEPALNPINVSYQTALEQTRALRLEKRYFSGVNIPPAMAYPAPGNTVAEQMYAETIPTIPADPYFRRETTWSQEVPVPKIPSPALDAPGRFREQQYLERFARETGAANVVPLQPYGQ